MAKLLRQPIRVAAVGLGWVTTNRHLPTMRADPRFNVVGVIDRRGERADRVARQHGLKHSHAGDDLSQVPWLDEVDAVTVGTCPMSHYSLVRQALLAGKDVLTEKPFAMTLAEGEDLVKLARAQGRILAVVHNFQFATSTQRLLGDIEAGRYGAVRGVHAHQLSNPLRRLPSWYEDLPLGLFYDESPHLLYLVRRLAPGPLRLRSADIHPSGTGRTPSLILVQYDCDAPGGNIPVVVSMNFEAPLSEWHASVMGEQYLGDVDIFRDIYLRLPNDGLHTTGTVFRTSIAATVQHWGQHFSSGLRHLSGRLRYGNDIVFGLFADAIATRREPDYIGPDDALAVLSLQHEIVSRYQGPLANPTHSKAPR